MRRSIRNRLAELLLRALDEPERRESILWIKLFCDLANRESRSGVPLRDLLAARAGLVDQRGGGATDLTSLTGPDCFFRLHRADTGDELSMGLAIPAGDIPWMVRLEPEACLASAEVGERVRAYLEVLASSAQAADELPEADPLRRAFRQAAACFNAGLFFEAHEHLETFWRSQPKGPTRRFLQGIIHICVGFHHARRGSYDGAVNQLGKGLEKTAGVTGEALGLNCDGFLPAVARVREAVMERGRAAMRPMPPHEVPPMLVSGMGRSQPQGE